MKNAHTIQWEEPHSEAQFQALAFGVWFGCIVLASIGEAVHRLLVVPTFGSFDAQWITGLMLTVLHLIAVWFFLSRVDEHPGRLRLLAVGMVWVVLTTVLEFGFRQFVADRYVMKLLADVLMHDYDTFGGRFWQAVLVIQLAAPITVGMVRDFAMARRRLL